MAFKSRKDYRLITALWFALGSNFCFALASSVYAEYSRSVSSFWMNFHKTIMAWLCFLLTIFALKLLVPLPLAVVLALLTSGLIGLCIGDLFLLKGFVDLGPGRTLMLFGFQPFLLGIFDYAVFDQVLPASKFVGVLFLVGCVLAFSWESLRLQGHWGTAGLINAFTGILLDAGGLVLTRWSFQTVTELSPFYANAIRTSGALIGFAFLFLYPPNRKLFFQPFLQMAPRDRWISTGAGILGTYVSLSFYLHALQIGPLATVSAIAGTAPLLASIFEVLRGRRAFTPFLFVGSLLFLIGFGIMTLTEF